ncbi:hypothetical protein SDC9_180934 [bioreactor metagenome]|uniref:Uncharacterized protein n=1 Tax=bioreactor metagenome TaxID=1076179 RepID=A0A645H4N9_9ZZZZ
MGEVLVLKELHGRKHRIGRGLTQAAQGVFLYIIGEFLKPLNVAGFPVAARDFVEHLE